MSNQETTSIAGRATRREVYRYIADHDGLPAPEQVSINTNGTVFLDFEALEDLDVWAAKLAAQVSVRREPKNGGRLLSYYNFGTVFLGYHGVLTCHEDGVGEERAEEIRCELNGFIDHEYETVSDIVMGRAVHSREVTGSDWNLQKAIDWALDQPEVSITCGPDGDRASVELIDGTVIAFDVEGELWCFEAADEVSS
jgi:hypothetical protein